MADETKTAKRSKPTSRSPAHPALNLQEAIQKAQVFYDKEHFQWAPSHVAMAHWDYGAKSSSGMRALAALLHYGLLEETGSGPARRVRLSDLGKDLILDGVGEQKRAKALREAALKPKVYADLWAQWKPKLPSDSTMRYTLEREKHFNPESIAPFIKDFKATIDFAKLAQSDILSGGESDKDQPDDTRGAEAEEEAPPGGGTPKGKEAPMPDIQRIEARPLDLPIPLIGGGQATLRVPIPLSEENYKHLTTMLTSMLGGMKPAIVADADASSAQ